MEECSVSDIGAESFSLLSRRCRTRQYQTEPALMAARSPNELIMERKAPTRTKEMTFFSLLNIRQWEGIDYRSVEEKFTSTLCKKVCRVEYSKWNRGQCPILQIHWFRTKFEVIYIKCIIVFGTQRIELSCIFH